MKNKGYITSYFKDKGYGFVKIDDGTSYFFHDVDKVNQKYVFQNGDEVSFDFSTRNNRINATNIIFIKNTKREKLIEEASTQEYLTGILTQIDNRYLVKHESSNVFLPVLNSILDIPNNPGDLIQFRLNTENTSNLKAIIKTEKDDLFKKIILNTTTKAKIISKNSGGLIVEIENFEMFQAFLPGSEIGLKPSDIELNTVIDVEIIATNKNKHTIIVSRKNTIVKQLNENKKQFLSQLVIGQTFNGTIANITNFGVFVKIEDCVGLLHKNLLTIDKKQQLNEVFSLGDSINTIIIGIDINEGKLSLGVAPQPKPVVKPNIVGSTVLNKHVRYGKNYLINKINNNVQKHTLADIINF